MPPKTNIQQTVESVYRRREAEKAERVRQAEEARTGLPFKSWAPRHFTIRPREAWRPIRYLSDFAQVLLREDGPKTLLMHKGSQLGYSMLLAGVHGWMVGERSMRVVCALPTDGEAGRYFRSYIRGVFNRVDRLRLWTDAQPDVSSMRGRHKTYTCGGESLTQGAGTEDRFASFVCDLMVLDEMDRYPVLDEGDSLYLAKRAVRNTGGKVVAGSTPTSAHGPSQIVAAWKACPVGFVYAVKCPECGDLDDVVWERFLWDGAGSPEERGATAKHGCGSCGALWTHRRLRKAVEGGAWLEGEYVDEDQFPRLKRGGLRVDRDGSLVGPKGGKRKWPDSAGFAINSLYSEWYSWPSAVRDWLAAQGDSSKQRVFVETILARPWMEEGDRVEAGTVRKLALASAPDDHRLAITAVDVQDGWLSVATFLYGPGEHCLLMDRREFNGTIDKVDGAAWVELSRWLATKPRWAGYPVRALVVDTGFHSDMTIRNSLRLKFDGPRLMVKGVSGFHAPSWKRSKTVVRGVRRRLYLLGVDALKMTIIQRYAGGHCRVLDSIPDAVISELEAEELVWAKTLGRRRRRWQQVGDRNELIDQSTYALAAARIINMSGQAIANLEKTPARRRRRKEFITD